MHPAISMIHYACHANKCGREWMRGLDRHAKRGTPADELPDPYRHLSENVKAAYIRALEIAKENPIPLKKEDYTPEEWTAHVSEIRRASAAKAVEVHKANARGRKPMSSISIRLDDAEAIRKQAIATGKPVAQLVHDMIAYCLLGNE